MARSLALVSDPAAPRSVVGVIVPTDRDCQRPSSTNRRTVDRRKKSHDSRPLEGHRASEPAPCEEKTEKKFASLGAPEGLQRRLAAPLRGGPSRRLLEEVFSIFGAVLEPQSRGVLVRDELESRGCLWGLPAIFMGSGEGILQMTQPSFDVRKTSREFHPSSCS